MAVARSGNGTGPAPDAPADARPGPVADGPPAVEVRRSGRRRRTVSAYREGGRTIVLIPARFTKAEERHWVDTMLGRLAAGDRRRRPDDAELSARARALSARYLADAARPTSVRWVGNQMSRWGSCTPADGTIRVSERLKGMPGYVLDYVLLHELAHLLRARPRPRVLAAALDLPAGGARSRLPRGSRGRGRARRAGRTTATTARSTGDPAQPRSP